MWGACSSVFFFKKIEGHFGHFFKNNFNILKTYEGVEGGYWDGERIRLILISHLVGLGYSELRNFCRLFFHYPYDFFCHPYSTFTLNKNNYLFLKKYHFPNDIKSIKNKFYVNKIKNMIL